MNRRAAALSSAETVQVEGELALAPYEVAVLTRLD
jgi:hypothetical protein